MKEPEYVWDVFISHSSQDKPVARRIAYALRREGVRVWFDEDEIALGDSIPAKIEEGLENSRTVLVCLSSNFLDSDWTAAERAVFTYDDPANSRPLVLPVKVAECELPRGLRHLRRGDAVIQSVRQVVDEVMNVLTRPERQRSSILSSYKKNPIRRSKRRPPHIAADDDDEDDAVIRARNTLRLLDYAVSSNYSGLIVVDLDGFTNINRVHGDFGGELVLRMVNHVVHDVCSRAIDAGKYESLAAWRGADEWFVYVGSSVAPEQGYSLARVAETLVSSIGDLDASSIASGLFVSACAGYAWRADPDEKALRLLRRSLLGLKSAKTLGTGRFREGPSIVSDLNEAAENEVVSHLISDSHWLWQVAKDSRSPGTAAEPPAFCYGTVRNDDYLTARGGSAFLGAW